jgi:hypothetical protein
LDSLADFEMDSRLTHLGLAAVWFHDRWVIAMGNVTMVSRDGITWTIGWDPAPVVEYIIGWDPDGLAAKESVVTSLVAGPDGLITTTCGGWGPHFTFYSEEGLEWTRVPDHEQFHEQVQAPHSGATCTDALGFVIVYADGDDDSLGRVDFSQDGRVWSSVDLHMTTSSTEEVTRFDYLLVHLPVDGSLLLTSG